MRLRAGRYRWTQGGWADWLFAGVFALAALALAFWQVFQLASLVPMRLSFFADTYTQLADSVQALPALWHLALPPSFALGLSAYGLAVVWLRAGGPTIDSRQRRRAWVQALSSQVVCLYYFELQLRTTLFSVIALGQSVPMDLPKPLAEFWRLEPAYAEYQMLCLAGALVLLYAILQTVTALRGVAARPRAAWCVIALFVVVAGATFFTFPQRDHRLMTRWSPLPADYLTEEEWEFITSEDFGSRIRDRYWKSFGPAPVLLNDDQMRYTHPDERCLDCILPRSPLLTLRGLPIRLDPQPPQDQQPTLVIELFSSGVQYRAYSFDNPQPSAPRGLKELKEDLAGAQWVLLKADASAHIAHFAGLISRLRGHGVRKLSLATFPVGYHRAPASPAILTTEFCETCSSYVRLPRPQGDRLSHLDRRRRMVVRQYLPDPYRKRPPLECDRLDSFLPVHTGIERPFYPPGLLPERIDLAAQTRHQTVQDFVNSYTRAWVGGAQEIHLNEQTLRRHWELSWIGWENWPPSKGSERGNP